MLEQNTGSREQTVLGYEVHYSKINKRLYFDLAQILSFTLPQIITC